MIHSVHLHIYENCCLQRYLNACTSSARMVQLNLPISRVSPSQVPPLAVYDASHSCCKRIPSVAKHKHDPTAKYCQLATAAIGGGASCRTWVFRGFWEDTGALKFITDRRSEKIGEIAADPCELVVHPRRFLLSSTHNATDRKMVNCDERIVIEKLSVGRTRYCRIHYGGLLKARSRFL